MGHNNTTNTAVQPGDPGCDKPTMSYADVARANGLSERQVQRATRAGKIARYRIGQSVRFSQADVDEFIAASRIPAGGGAA